MGGGGGTIGAAAAARAPADGYTLLLGTTSELVISPMLARQSYDPVASFEPIAIICDSPAAIVVHPSVPVSNLKRACRLRPKQNKDKMNYGSAGAGTVSNLAGELFKRAGRFAGPDAHSLQGRRAGAGRCHRRPDARSSTPMMSEQIYELHRQGKLRVLAVASEQRLTRCPTLPTGGEQGYPDLVARLFFGLFAPAKTPKPIIAKIEQATQLAMQDPALQKSFAGRRLRDAATRSAHACARSPLSRSSNSPKRDRPSVR